MRAMRASQEEVFTSDGEYEFDDEVITSGGDNVTGKSDGEHVDDNDDSEVFKTDDFKDYSDDSDDSEPLELRERIGNNIIMLRGYAKHDGIKNGKVTGKALLINKTPNLSVIDIDINKSLSDDEKDTIRCNILNKLSDDNVIVKTGSGGLHIYCNTGEFPVTKSNRMIKCYQCDSFDLDLMTSVDESSRSLIVLPGSKVRSSHKEGDTGKVTSYMFIKGGYHSQIKHTINDVLTCLGINLTVTDTDDMRDIIEESKNTSVDSDLYKVIIDGLAGLEVHNDAGYMPIEKEITLFTLFLAINALPNKDLIDYAYDYIYDNCNLTTRAKQMFGERQKRYVNSKTSPFVLVKILKLYANEYYETKVKPLMNHDIIIRNMDFKDEFTLDTILKKAENHCYAKKCEFITDLSRVIRRLSGTEISFVSKIYNTHTDSYTIGFVTSANMKEMLKAIKLWKVDNKQITGWDVFTEHAGKLIVKGVKFYSTDRKNYISTFHGYKYNILNKVNKDVIDTFLTFVKEVICDSNNEIYNYVINWVSYMIQNPGKKTETALILKGLQGIGKNTFTDVLCELLAGYSDNNVTDMEELTGKFNSVVENKMLIILNELKNVGDERLANFNSLKSVITDRTIRINEKNQPRRTSENVANFIFCTNNSYPVKIEPGDRRYVVLQVNGKYQKKFDYFKKLHESFDKEFYNNLLTYFARNDLKHYNVRYIPLTEAKQDLIKASRSPLDVWICENYNMLIEGIRCSDVRDMKPMEMKERAFALQIKDKCNHIRKQVDGKREYFYVLKDECKSIYSQTRDDEEEDTDE